MFLIYWSGYRMGFMVVVLIMKIFFVIMVIDYGGKFKFGYSG